MPGESRLLPFLLPSPPLCPAGTEPCRPAGQDIYSTIKKSQQNGKIPRFRRVRGGGELYTSDTVMQSECGTLPLRDPAGISPRSPQGTSPQLGQEKLQSFSFGVCGGGWPGALGVPCSCGNVTAASPPSPTGPK